MRLEELIRPLLLKEVTGNPGVEIRGVETDSRRVRPGDLFIALRGFTEDGHRYVPEAVRRGAAAVVAEVAVEPGPGGAAPTPGGQWPFWPPPFTAIRRGS